MNEARINLNVVEKDALAKTLFKTDLWPDFDEPGVQALAHQAMDQWFEQTQDYLIKRGVSPALLLEELEAFGKSNGSAGGGDNPQTADQLKRVGPNMEKLGLDWQSFFESVT